MTTTVNGSNATCTVTINGAPLSNSVRVYDLVTTHTINGIPKAILRILDGDPSTGNFEVSSSATFIPGNSISIALGYNGTNTVVFNGIVTGQEIRIDENIGSMLEVECYDNAIQLTVENKNACYTDKSDAEIMHTIINSYPALYPDATDAFISSPMRVQQNCSDWDFLLALADANGMVVKCDNSSITVTDPLANTAPALTIGYGEGLLAFNAKLNSINQYASLQVQSWDNQQQQQQSATATASYTGPGNLDPKKLAAVVGPADYRVNAAPAMDTNTLTVMAAAQLKRSVLAKICGTAKIQGTALAAAGAFITLKGLGDRFNGDYFISGVTQTFNGSNWLSTIDLGLAATQQYVSMNAPACMTNGVSISSGSLPEMCGCAITCDDVSKTITLTDQNGNCISLSPAGISMKSTKNISIESGEQISLKGILGVTVNSNAGDFNVNAMNITETANMEMILKASMIHIN